MKKLSQFLKSHVSGMLDVILLKIGMWSTDIGKRVSTAKIFWQHGAMNA